ncbi:MAG TPA: hypothetical protein VFW40_04375 [Capsulimonadaceae bacterium]|nr:hypothetical protein [Capsulimonadaceae bacterium]
MNYWLANGLYWHTVIPAGLASFVEFVEALTIVLAVASVRGWRSAIAGTVAGLIVLVLLVAALGPAIRHIRISYFQIAVGALLLLFGLRWLRKAILRAAGYIALHDEAKAYDKEVAHLSKERTLSYAGIDLPAAGTAFNGVVLEGAEVVFIVLAVGTTAGRMAAAVVGAAVALLLVVALGLALRAPLTRIPENALKFVVGAMLSALGTLWSGEGLGFTWPGGDWSAAMLFASYALVAVVLIVCFKTAAQRPSTRKTS